MCVLTNKRFKHIKRDFPSIAWIMPQRGDFGALGCPGGQKLILFERGHVEYQIDGGDEQNRLQVKRIL